MLLTLIGVNKMYQKKFMQEASQNAESNVGTQIGGPFGCVIVKDGKVIASSKNHVLKNNDPSAHGEIMTIRKACKKLGTYDLNGCELYTNAYPCPMCLGAIIWSNIKKVYYRNTAKDAKKIGFRDDFIYKFLDGKCTDKQVLDLEQHDRNMTINSFRQFINNSQSTIY